MTDSLVGPAEIQQRLGISESTFHRWTKHPAWPAPALWLSQGRVYRFKDVEAWVAKHRGKAGRPRVVR